MMIHIGQQDNETGEIYILADREIKTEVQLNRFLLETKENHHLKPNCKWITAKDVGAFTVMWRLSANGIV